MLRWLSVALLVAGAAWGEPVEIVQSVPAETNLSLPGIRETREVWLEMIGGARSTLDIETFYVRNEKGKALEGVIEAVIAAAGRGVKVRLLADKTFEGTYPETLLLLSKVPGIEVRTLPMKERAGGVMHAKYFLVDGQQLFLGSQNFDWTSLSQIHEVGVRIEDATLTGCLAQIFEEDWALARADVTPSPARIVVSDSNPVAVGVAPGARSLISAGFSPRKYTPAGLEPEEDVLVRLLDSARREVLVQVMTYSPVHGKELWPTLDLALRRAAVRGVKVRFLIADWGTRQPGLDFLRSLDLVPGVEVRVVTIPQFSGGPIPFARVDHSKYIVVDAERACVSTSNFEYGYFYDCRDISLVFAGGPANGQLRRIFEQVWTGPYAAALRLTGDYPKPK